MNREEAKELLPIMQAFAEGKRIEYSNDGENWFETTTPTWDTDFVYRIKPEFEYLPFTSQEECWNEMQKHHNFGWVKSKTRDANKHISNIEKDIEGNVCFITASFSGIERFSAKQMFNYFEFMDGTPFGIKEE